MSLQLYDLAGAEPERRFSPYCWRTKLALVHKALAVETIPWRFTDKDVIAFSGQGRVPVLVDADRVVSIHGRSRLTWGDLCRSPVAVRRAGRQGTGSFRQLWADNVIAPGIARLVLADIHTHLHEKDLAYFRETRE